MTRILESNGTTSQVYPEKITEFAGRKFFLATDHNGNKAWFHYDTGTLFAEISNGEQPLSVLAKKYLDTANREIDRLLSKFQTINS